tara:strand:- start:11940 stop:12278 length:339 start_codon:yes stop_codon:yes gene_type:complete
VPRPDQNINPPPTNQIAPYVEELLKKNGTRGEKAIEAIQEDRVKQYRDFTVVVGYHDEYIVEGEICTCKGSEYNLQNDTDKKCWHLLAVEIAERTGSIDYHDMWYSEVRDLL